MNVFRACREAAGQRHYEIDYAKVKITNPDRLDEIRIAEIVGADGVRPYLTRPAHHIGRAPDGSYQVVRNEKGFAWTLAAGSDNRAKAGNWTWPMLWVMCSQGELSVAGKSKEYRRAIRALDDAGLLKITTGPRGGLGTATFRWLPWAYLPEPVHEHRLADVDALALAALG